MTEFEEAPEFTNEIKKLQKKYKSLYDDLEVFKKALRLLPDTTPGSRRVSGLGQNVKIPIFKERGFRCKYMKKGSRSGIRIIYAYEEKENKVTFIEIYYKGKKSSHDKARILKYFEEKS